MKFLIDTNVFIPLEPTAYDDIEGNTLIATKLENLSKETGQQLLLHPSQKIDLKNDKNAARRKTREIQFTKYPCLSDLPPISEELEKIIGKAEPESNDWVDNQLLSALVSDAVDCLITEDVGIINKSKKFGLQERVLNLTEAISFLEDYFDTTPEAPPAIKSLKAYSLNDKDPIFNSLRIDYPEFNSWLSKCKLEHRQTWIVKTHDSDKYAGMCIVKKENSVDFGLEGKLLKICTFKIAESFNGVRFGELLLKTVFTYANLNGYDWIYLEIKQKYERTINFFKEFGFDDNYKEKSDNEIRLAKPMKYTEKEKSELDSLEFNKRFGPFCVKFQRDKSFIVPIQPNFHRLLFPDVQKQDELFPGENPFGNSIRKAYLSNSNIRTISPGSLLFFYRSGDLREVKIIGIVEDTLVSLEAREIARFVGIRTVYKYHKIETMCQREVLAILFRQASILKTSISYGELVSNSILISPPQSIKTIEERFIPWLENRIDQ